MGERWLCIHCMGGLGAVVTGASHPYGLCGSCGARPVYVRYCDVPVHMHDKNAPTDSPAEVLPTPATDPAPAVGQAESGASGEIERPPAGGLQMEMF